MTKQRCGNCKWWEGWEHFKEGKRRIGTCSVPTAHLQNSLMNVLPASARITIICVFSHEGKECPTWAAKPKERK